MSGDQLQRNKRTIMSSRSKFCHYCGVRKANTVDHKIPLAKGGTNSLNNLVQCCNICNTEKGHHLDYKTFRRFTKKFGMVKPGWYKNTNMYIAHAIKKITHNVKDEVKRKELILSRFGDKGLVIQNRRISK